MKHSQKTSAFISAVFCVSLAGGIGVGFYSCNFFQLAGEVTKKNVAVAIKSVPTVRADVRVPILVYHSVRPHITKESSYQETYDITPELLRKHLEYLKENNYTAISFDMLADYFDTDTPLPAKPIILTFDDGWKNQYEYAFPILKEFNDTATFFIFTNAVGRGNHLAWEEIHEMSDMGISIGAHTKTHPYLRKITDENILSEEIAGSKKILEDELEMKVTSFAYPFGQYNDVVAEEVKKSEFRIARSLQRGVMQNEGERYILRANLATDNFEDFVRLLEK